MDVSLGGMNLFFAGHRFLSSSFVHRAAPIQHRFYSFIPFDKEVGDRRN